MSFRMSRDTLNRRPSRPPASPNSIFNIVMMMGALAIGLAMLDAWMTDGRYLRYILSDGMRPFRTLFDGLHVKGL